MTAHSQRLLSLYAFILACLITMAVFSNTLHNSFHFDDMTNIITNPTIKDLSRLKAIWDFWPTRFTNFLTLALNYKMGGLEVFGYHIVNVLIHGMSVVLVWCVAMMTMPRVKDQTLTYVQQLGAVFLITLIFSVHPLQTQPVNYITQRSVLLAGFLSLLSLVSYIKAREHSLKQRAWSATRWMALGLCAGMASMFSKENAIILPVLIFLYEVCFFKDERPLAWTLLAPIFALVLVIPVTWQMTKPIDIFAWGQVREAYAGAVTQGQYALTQIQVVFGYLRLLVWPLDQSVDYDVPLVTTWARFDVVVPALFMAALVLCAVKYRRRYPLSAFGVMWFFTALLPESSFWPNQDVMVEHRLYLPLLGFAFFIVGVCVEILPAMVRTRALAIVVVMAGMLAGLSYQRNAVWLNEFSLWDDAVHHQPKSARAYLNRGAAYQREGDLDKAMADYNMVIGLGPVTAVTLSNRGNIFRLKGEKDLALANFNLAIQINSGFPGTYVNRGLLYLQDQQWDLALADFNKAVEFMPQDQYVRKIRDEIIMFKSQKVDILNPVP